MPGISDYAEWQQRWPEFIVRVDTPTAVTYLETYYSLRANGQPRYSGSRFESVAAMNPDPNTIGLADFVAVSMLSVNVPGEAALRLLGPDSSNINRLLSQIPVDLDIVDADPSSLGGESPAAQLWSVLRQGRDGVGRTTTSKLLAAKRPRLLPIWDSFVEIATGLDTSDNWRKFQYVLVEDDRRLWKWLQSLRSEVKTLPPTVSELRILDVLLWMSVKSEQ